MAVRQGPGDGEGVPVRCDDGAAPEDAAQTLDMGQSPTGEVAERAFTDAAVLAVALAQEDGGR